MQEIVMEPAGTDANGVTQWAKAKERINPIVAICRGLLFGLVVFGLYSGA